MLHLCITFCSFTCRWAVGLCQTFGSYKESAVNREAQMAAWIPNRLCFFETGSCCVAQAGFKWNSPYSSPECCHVWLKWWSATWVLTPVLTKTNKKRLSNKIYLTSRSVTIWAPMWVVVRAPFLSRYNFLPQVIGNSVISPYAFVGRSFWTT
jgi:hypothetical protein